MIEGGMEAAAEKMRAAGAHEAIRAFESAYRRLESGQEAMLPTAELEPAGDVPALEGLKDADPARALEHVVVIKLNGGLATSMGLQEPKSLVQAREGRSFLDIIIGQTLALRHRYDVRLPLVLMNSDATWAATERALQRHPEIVHEGLEPDFMQSMIPKLDADSLAPVSWPQAPALEWCPPGHGDVYGALRRSGMLAALLDRGFRYAMISNADNLGAALDPRIAAYLLREEVRSSSRWCSAPRPIARVAISLAAGPTVNSFCARPRRPRPRTRPHSVTSGVGATTTPTTSGSICALWPRRLSARMACSSSP